ncbi:MAG TPA: protein usg [Methylocystis sp.]|nr:protein usg [Methylocystis sp.]
MASGAFLRRMEGYRLTSADILYRLPDSPRILQSYLWQDCDIYPDYIELRKFLAFWSRDREGLLHSVTVSHSGLIKPAEFSFCKGEFLLN